MYIVLHTFELNFGVIVSEFYQKHDAILAPKENGTFLTLFKAAKKIACFCYQIIKKKSNLQKDCFWSDV